MTPDFQRVFAHAVYAQIIPTIIIAAIFGLLLRFTVEKTCAALLRLFQRKPVHKGSSQMTQLNIDDSILDAPPCCPACAEPMVKRKARYGEFSGISFWGCKGFPRCRGTRPI